MIFTSILSAVLGVLPDFLVKYIGLKNDALRIQADEVMDRRRAQRDVLIAEQGSWLTRSIRPLWALPFVIYAWKLVVWDKVLGLGSTDPLTGGMDEWATIIIGAYFLAEAGERITAKIVNRKK